GEPAHERLLAYPRGADQQVRVDGPARRGPQLPDGVGLAHDVGEQLRGREAVRGNGIADGVHGAPSGRGPRRSTTAPSTRAATASTSPVPATTAHPVGSAAASAA